jgi:protein TonB
MFEDATFESMGTIHTRSRNWMIATFGFNASILAALIAIPLFHPSMLPQMFYIDPLIAPAPVEETHPVVRQDHQAAHASDMFENRVVAPRLIPRDPWIPNTPEPTGATGVMNLGGPATLPGIGCNPFNCGAARPDVRPAVQVKPHISSGVMEGMLIVKVLPVYPAPARAMRIAGRVELQATISRDGTIENLRVVDGPALLRAAAVNAVQQWRYRPYLLNGDPVEVETTINVDFKLD